MPSVAIDIAIPVLNEEKDLLRSVEKVIAFFEQASLEDYRIQLVIADNGSTDQTADLGRALAAAHPQYVRYVRLEERGVGRALKRVWNESTADIVGYFDADLATDLKHFPEAVAALKRYDVDFVYGSRLNKQSTVIGRSIKREITSRVFNVLLKLYLGTHFSDGMCGFKFLRRSILNSLQKAGAVSDGWFFATELLVTAEWLGYKLYELPIDWVDRSESRVRIVPLALQYIQAMRILKGKRSVFK